MTVPHLSPPIWGLVFVLSASLLLWLLSLRLKDASIADIFWGPGMAGVVDITAWLGGAGGTRGLGGAGAGQSLGCAARRPYLGPA
ncbi:MAG TPA: hypothetical protein VLL04_13875 [Rhizomicrobium sp.]|nr:hypothetical protein [Rhizomicrobium sp.]